MIAVKLGGSIITDRSRPRSVNYRAIRRLGSEIAEAQKALKGTCFVLANGSGSFGHKIEVEHKISDGFSDTRGRLWACRSRHEATIINQIIVGELLKLGVAATSLSPSAIMTTTEGTVAGSYWDTLGVILQLGIVPVIHGDEVWDMKSGCVVFSSETCLRMAVEYLKENGWKVPFVIQCTDVDGVFKGGDEKILLPEITKTSFERVAKQVGGSRYIDSTGGMAHKVRESLMLAEQGIPSFIINGKKRRRVLRSILLRKPVIGTVIH